MIDYPGMNKYIDFRKIPVSLNSCRGLAWRSEGTITYESDGKIYSEDGKVLAEGVDATRFYWVSDDLLLYRDPKGVLWAQNTAGGKKEKLGDSLAEEFSYTPISLVTTSEGKYRVVRGTSGVPSLVVGTIRVPYWDVTPFSDIPEGIAVRTPDGRMLSGKARQSVFIGTKQPVVNTYALKFAFPKKANIRDIKNPAAYRYGRGGEGTYKSQVVSVNQVILLKQGRVIAAIKPVEIHIDKANKAKSYMVYEWKFWPK